MPAAHFSRQAEQDLHDIWSYVGQDSLDAADSVVEQITETCQTLAQHPRMGRLRVELRPVMRSFAVGNYVVFYGPEPDGIVVFRVLHGARDVSELM